MKQRIHFEDKGQDLIYLDIEIYEGGTGRIIGVSATCSPVVWNYYRDKAVLADDMVVGKEFLYAAPAEGFTVYSNKLIIESIEEIK